MGPGYFVIAILGCADGGSSCTPVATLQAHYATAAECSAATAPALEANTNFDFSDPACAMPRRNRRRVS